MQLSLQAAASDEDAAAQPCTGTDGGAVSASTGVSLQTAAELLAQVPVEDAGGNRPGSGRLCPLFRPTPAAAAGTFAGAS